MRDLFLALPMHVVRTPLDFTFLRLDKTTRLAVKLHVSALELVYPWGYKS